MMHAGEPGSRRLTAHYAGFSTMYLHEDKTARWDESRMRDGRKEQWGRQSTREWERKGARQKSTQHIFGIPPNASHVEQRL